MTQAQAPLAAKLDRLTTVGEGVDRDEILNLFLEHVAELAFDLYPAQEESILELMSWHHVVLNTPTGSGKSLVAQALHFQAMAEKRVSYYTSPIKALVNEKFFDLCDVFGPENVGMMTGDAAVNREAPILCCTAEILANMALRQPDLCIDYVVMDEFHYYGDRDRGMAWQIPLITLKNTVFLLMSATLGDMTEIAKRLDTFSNREVAVVTGVQRPVPLSFEYKELATHEVVQELLDRDQAPIYLVNFTQRACAEQAQNLVSLKVCSREERQALSEELGAMRFDTPYGKELSRFLRAGIGVHHAGLLPRYRLLVEKLSQAGMLKVISGTDSLGVGVNIPIRTVLFRQLCKFNGEKTAILTGREFHQIAGRAGRRGFDDAGLVVAQSPEHVAENKKLETKRIKNPHLKNKLVNKKAPVRGYVHWDEKTFKRLVGLPPEPLVPHFSLNHGVLINALQSESDAQGGGYGRLVTIIGRSHLREAEQRLQRRLAAQLFRALRHVGVIELVRESERPVRSVRVRLDLQKDFSLNQALSLFLVEAIELLDTGAEAYPLDALTLVESILEDPQAVLFKQVDRLKGELVGKLKAEGVEYDERMAQLELVEYPKPNAEDNYTLFNIFAKGHPWVGNDTLKPKSIAREMYEECMGFNDYVRALGLARSEGVLLRYLSQVYKTALQNVPESHRSEAFDDVLSYFHTMLMRVDSSLIEEWEKMMDGEDVRIRDRRSLEEEPKRPRDLASDFKSFQRRLRNEMFMLLKAVADRNYEDACECVRQGEDDAWTDKRFEAAMQPYFEEHTYIDLSPRARHTQNTILRDAGDRKWQVLQKVIDPEGNDDWVVEGLVDLNVIVDESEPLIALVRIGV